MDRAFRLGLTHLSVARLRQLAFSLKKDVSKCETKEDFVGLLDGTMSKSEKFTALRDDVLAGQTSLALFGLENAKTIAFKADFTKATSVPSIVEVGRKGELIDDLKLVAWAVLDSNSTYLDAKLELRTKPEATVVFSFYDPIKEILQVRANFAIARKIGREWARMAGVDPEKDLKQIGLTTVEDVHAFVDMLEGSVIKCTGQKLKSKGFHKVSGSLHPNMSDLRGTEDYDQFLKEAASTSTDVEFQLDDEGVHVGFGLTTQSIVFRTISSEAVIQYVYKKLNEFLEGKGV